MQRKGPLPEPATVRSAAIWAQGPASGSVKYDASSLALTVTVTGAAISSAWGKAAWYSLLSATHICGEAAIRQHGTQLGLGEYRPGAARGPGCFGL